MHIRLSAGSANSTHRTTDEGKSFAHVPTVTKAFLRGGLTLFVGISAANVLPPAVQIVVYLVGLAAVLGHPRKIASTEAVLLSAALLSILSSRIAAGTGVDGAFRMVRPLFEGYLLAHTLYFWCGIRSFRDVTCALGGFITIQFFFGLAMAVDPALRSSMLESIYSDEGYQGTSFIGALLFRGYGFSRHHLYGLPLAVGLATALLAAQGRLERRLSAQAWIIALTIAGILIVSVNARIGLFPILITPLLGLTFFYNPFHGKQIIIVLAFALTPLLYFGTSYFGDNFEAVAGWLAEGATQLNADGDAGSTTVSDLSSMVHFSDNPMHLLFGAGRLCSIDDRCYSDIGIVRASQEGGLILLALIFALYFRLGSHALALASSRSHAQVRKRSPTYLLIAAILHLTFIAAMVKGEAFAANDYSRLAVTLGCLGMLFKTPARRPRRRRLISSTEDRQLPQESASEAHDAATRY